MELLLFTATGLGLWSLRLMHVAIQRREASLIFAGTLVALSAIGVVAVYLLMDSCIGYLGHGADSLAQSLPTVLVQPEQVQVVSP